MDSLSSMDIPAWGYGLRYQYGSKSCSFPCQARKWKAPGTQMETATNASSLRSVFMQGIDKDGNQTEIPDPWLTGSNPWEVGTFETHQLSQNDSGILTIGMTLCTYSPPRQYRLRQALRSLQPRCIWKQQMDRRSRGTSCTL